jgi:hypothetical protein
MGRIKESSVSVFLVKKDDVRFMAPCVGSDVNMSLVALSL